VFSLLSLCADLLAAVVACYVICDLQDDLFRQVAELAEPVKDGCFRKQVVLQKLRWAIKNKKAEAKKSPNKGRRRSKTGITAPVMHVVLAACTPKQHGIVVPCAGQRPPASQQLKVVLCRRWQW